MDEPMGDRLTGLKNGKGHSSGALVCSLDDPVDILAALQHRGYFVLPLSAEILEAQEDMFEQFDAFDNRPVSEKAIFSLTPDIIGENNGLHGAGGLSRYNQCREGIIFQASCSVWPMLSGDISAPPDAFSMAHERFRHEAHLLASSIMERIASALELPDPVSYFTSNGPLDVIRGSQFHVKKVKLSETEDLSALHKTPEGDRYLTLRAHRDPSVISVVFHKIRCEDDAPGIGLQFKDPDVGTFENMSFRAGEVAGGAMCVVIAGSILELLSSGKIKAPLHRVISTELELKAADRLAATFFFQPNLDSFLIPFLSTSVKTTCSTCTTNNTGSSNGEDIESDGYSRGSVGESDIGRKSQSKTKTNSKESATPITYGKWKSKAYGSYYKGK